MATVDNRKQKIRELKQAIKTAQDEVVDLFSAIDVKKESQLSEEEQKAKKEEFKVNIAKTRAMISSYQEELKQIRANKLGSSFFEFTPNKGMNRRQARAFRRMNKK